MKNRFLASILILFILGCASVSSPTGGVKDTTPPELLAAKPKDQSTNFNGREITLFFSEWMKEESLTKELIITPRIQIEYEHLLKKQEFVLTFEEDLPDSTTFTLNFRKALKDITEGNLWQDPKISFSTGPFLDSMKVTGTVTDALTQTPLANYTIGLYDIAYDTANLRQGEPLYFTTTGEKGLFDLTNVKAGRYLLYGFSDANDNLINSSANEPYTFYPDTLNLTDSIPPLFLLSYKVNEDTLMLSKAAATGKDFKIKYNKGISNYLIYNPSDSAQNFYGMLENDGKDLRIFKENLPDITFNNDSLALYITVTDTLGTSRSDTVFAKFRDSKVTNPNLTITKQPNTEVLNGSQSFTIAFNKSVHHINYDSIFFAINDSLIYDVDSSQLALSANDHFATISSTLLQNQVDTVIARLKRLDTEKQKAMSAASDSSANDTTASANDSLPNNQIPVANCSRLH